MRRFFSWSVVALAAMLTSCGPSYRDEFNRDSATSSWTEEQKLAARHFSYRLKFSRETTDHKFVTVYGLLDYDDLLKQLTQIETDFNSLLDPSNQENSAYLDATGSRKATEHQEKVVKLLRRRVVAAKLDVTFKTLMGQLSSVDGEHANGFSTKKIFSPDDPATTFPFTSDQIEAA